MSEALPDFIYQGYPALMFESEIEADVYAISDRVLLGTADVHWRVTSSRCSREPNSPLFEMVHLVRDERGEPTDRLELFYSILKNPAEVRSIEFVKELQAQGRIVASSLYSSAELRLHKGPGPVEWRARPR